MAQKRGDPYRNFNFLVDFGAGDPVGFCEVVLPEGSIAVVEYREGSDKLNVARKLPGRAHLGNVVLRRGFAGDLSLYAWWNGLRHGAQDFRAVRIELLSEDRSSTVAAWHLRRAWPVRIAFGPLRGLGDEVLVETLELAFDDFELE
jgi:phage tail-like protein